MDDVTGINSSVSESVDNFNSRESEGFESSDSESQGNEQSVNASNSAPAEGSEPIAAQTPQTVLIKVNGQEQEISVDELQRHYGLASAAQRKMSEAARVQQEYDRFMQGIKTNPIDILKQLNPEFDERSYAEKIIEAQIEQEMLTPEQRRIRELEQRISSEEQARQQEAQQQQEAKYQEEVNKYREEYERNIINSLQQSGLPNTPGTVKKMAEYLSFNHQNGLGLTNEQMVAMVREDYVNDIKTMFGPMDGEGLLGLLGDDVANKIRKADLARLRKGREATSPKVREIANRDGNQRTTARKALTVDEWRAQLDARTVEED